MVVIGNNEKFPSDVKVLLKNNDKSFSTTFIYITHAKSRLG